MDWAAAHHGELSGEGGGGAPEDGLWCGLCQNKKESSENLTLNSAVDENEW
jgi:hypothetical protein